MNPTEDKASWTPGKKDFIFLSIVAAVILILVLGTSDRTTKAVPNDATHLKVTAHDECMACHGADGIKPQPKGHTRGVQCFQCHMQPKDWGKTTP